MSSIGSTRYGRSARSCTHRRESRRGRWLPSVLTEPTAGLWTRDWGLGTRDSGPTNGRKDEGVWSWDVGSSGRTSDRGPGTGDYGHRTKNARRYPARRSSRVLGRSSVRTPRSAILGPRSVVLPLLPQSQLQTPSSPVHQLGQSPESRVHSPAVDSNSRSSLRTRAIFRHAISHGGVARLDHGQLEHAGRGAAAVRRRRH